MLITDQHILNLVAISERLHRRIIGWFDSTELTQDSAQKIPDQRVRECISQVAKVTLEVARLDMDRSRLANKGGAQLTNEQYEEGMRQLRSEAINAMSTSELAQEIHRRSEQES
jgi:hypothetical protein